MSDERIVAAAVESNGLIFSKPAPARHHNVLRSMSEDFGIDAIEHGKPDNQGFLTNKGRFLGRIGAAALAKDVGQIERLQFPPFLYSEDLW